MAKIDTAKVMRRAWGLFRTSMQRFSRAVFAGFLRQAWAEAKDAPVTPYAYMQRWAAVPFGASRTQAIRIITSALECARVRAARYSRAGEPCNWSAAKHRSADIMRVAGLEALLAAETAGRGA
ncbi:hypothetical protein [Xanthobacter tagetidis]|uniref:Uncharacterized protein n=1 Tax=Xanthobacter tagetidis TaxID=60216 RepID=A0A3L7A128_9HYPH|nr:hypothetical protein [Xanthobacter tagetidis]MBB6307139.1 hypothetical protein [Xanthobacter tagetidis]RLP73983.1 hypothetical protein D9R14_19575 [Xanthobacter tagetidis]